MNITSQALKIQGRNIYTLLLLDIKTRYISNRLGFLMAFIDPIVFVIFLCAFFMAMGRAPMIGDSLILFFMTAVFPFFCYRSINSEVSMCTQKNRSLFFFPILKPLDLILAVTINQVVTYMIGFFVVVYAVVLIVDAEMPDNVEPAVIVFLIIGVFGFSVGIINKAIQLYFAFWKNISMLINRGLMLTSGKFFIADSLPQNAQDILYYNPILHLTEFVRTGFYKGFASKFVDMSYPLTVTFVLFFIAMVCERMFRKQMMAAKA